MQWSNETYQGYDCLQFFNQSISLWIAKSVGLRILGFGFLEGDNILAELPEIKIPLPEGGAYQLRGGHRLWYAPERPETTYIPDDQPVETRVQESSVEQIQPVDETTGIQKSWTISLAEEAPSLQIQHRLTNQGNESISAAPWAITMLKPGGVGIFPQLSKPVDDHGLLANRHLVLWPYTPVNSPFIHWGDEGILIESRMKKDALKIGFPNPKGWLAYTFGDLLFVKRAEFDRSAVYFDRGASSEVYCCKDFIELETLGGYRSLEPGDTLHHTETWEIYREDDWPEEIAELYHTKLKAGWEE